MAVKAAAEATVYDQTDATDLVMWWRATTSGTVPSAPTTTDASATPSGWTRSEPTIASDADLSKYVYTCLQLVWGDGTCSWGDVSMSASFEAAKRAYNLGKSASNKVDNLAIGGRNLLYDTSDWSKWAKTAKATSSGDVLTCANTDTSSGFQRANGWFTLAKADVMDREITISFDVKKTDATALSTLVFQMFTTSATPKSVASGNINEGSRVYQSLGAKSTDRFVIENAGSINATTWTRVSLRFVPSVVFNTTYTEQAYLAVYVGINANVASAQFRRIKAEFGNKPTDWTAAPEDTEADIAQVRTDAFEGIDGANASIEELSGSVQSVSDDLDETRTNLSDDIAGLRSDFETDQAAREQWLTFNGSDGMTIGEASSEFKTHYTSTDIDFIQGDEVLMNLNGTDGVNAPKVTANEVHLGGWMWVNRENGNLSLKYIG